MSYDDITMCHRVNNPGFGLVFRSPSLNINTDKELMIYFIQLILSNTSNCLV